MTAAVAETHRVSGPHTDADWSVPAGPLEWSCRDTAVHIAHDLLAYATQLAAGPTDAYLPLALPWTPPAALTSLVLARLFPDAPEGASTPVLLWCTGRTSLPGHPRRTSWTWQAART
ncbi:hypothetical protein ACPCDX_27995 [Streptomyces koyangensis]|uniref:hypothetical protein n=1 Tax=Streptomyces koyangensis TaxID=188770 RepID=UPI003C2E489A